MADKLSEVVVQFKQPPSVLFGMESDKDLNPNLLTMCLQPDEGAHLWFEVKVPGQGMTMQSRG